MLAIILSKLVDIIYLVVFEVSTVDSVVSSEPKKSQIPRFILLIPEFIELNIPELCSNWLVESSATEGLSTGWDITRLL